MKFLSKTPSVVWRRVITKSVHISIFSCFKSETSGNPSASFVSNVSCKVYYPISGLYYPKIMWKISLQLLACLVTPILETRKALILIYHYTVSDSYTCRCCEECIHVKHKKILRLLVFLSTV